MTDHEYPTADEESSDGGQDKDLDRFDVAVGYKECDRDSTHIFAADYPGSACPHADGGTLSLVML